MWRKIMIIAALQVLFAQVVWGQASVTVPDVTGMTVPVAAAALNHAGLALGHEVGEAWTAESGLAQNTIAVQSVAPGTAVEAGTAIDLTVLHSPNTLLLYDDNDLTLVNQTGADLDLTGLIFQAQDGNQASFAASCWGASLREGRCAQLWSVGRNGPKGLDECQYIEHWLATTNNAEHFWTGEGGTTQFSVNQNGIERALCPVANPGRCEFYLPSAGAQDVTGFVYLVYTQDRLAIINNTDDRWMPLGGLRFLNNYVEPRGAAINPADSSLYGSNRNPAADLQRLAPGQCILFTNSSPDSQTPPQACDVVAQLNVGPSVIFWAADFPVDGVTDNLDHACPAATSEGMTLCIMPR